MANFETAYDSVIIGSDLIGKPSGKLVQAIRNITGYTKVHSKTIRFSDKNNDGKVIAAIVTPIGYRMKVKGPKGVVLVDDRGHGARSVVVETSAGKHTVTLEAM
jgi:hypothetical protein